MASNKYNVTPEQIIDHRAMRKKCGLVGCVDGSDGPLNSLSGISWRPADPKNPSCFCHDCRSLWDKDGTIDAELVNAGHKKACFTYDNLLPKQHTTTPVASPLPARTMTEHPEAYKMGVPREVFFPPPLLKRTDGSGSGTLCADDSLTEGMPWSSKTPTIPPPPPTPPFTGLRVQIPPRTQNTPTFSLPAPRHRDIMNETRDVRIKKDLLEMLTQFRSEMIDVMDSRRRAMFYDNHEEREAYLAEVSKNESALWEKITAAEVLISSLDG